MSRENVLYHTKCVRTAVLFYENVLGGTKKMDILDPVWELFCELDCPKSQTFLRENPEFDFGLYMDKTCQFMQFVLIFG